MSSVLGIGNALVDILATLQTDELLGKYSLPKGSMQHVDRATSNSVYEELVKLGCNRISGGSAANTINGLAKLGIKSAFIGKIGDDELGAEFAKDQLTSGVRPILLSSAVPSGRAMVLISNDAERTFAVYLGAAVELCAQDLKEEMFGDYSYFHIEGYMMQNHELFENAVKHAKNAGMKVSMDMASYNVVGENRDFLTRMLKNYIDIVFANEDEAKAFTGLEPDLALHELATFCDIAVVKIGKSGSMVKQRENYYPIAPTDEVAVDATGAGDMYASGFLFGLSKGLPLEKCGEIGSICSGKVVEVVGAKMSDSTWDELRTQINRIVND